VGQGIDFYGMPDRPGQQLQDQLMAQLQGRGPSVAGLQLQSGLGQLMAGQAGAAASNPALGSAMGARLAMQQGTQAMMGTNQQAAQLRAQEQMQAQQALAALMKQREDAQRANQALQLAGMSAYDQMRMQQDLANAGLNSQQGFGGMLMSGVSGLLGGLLS
jgi:hypothetical protein